MLSSKSSFLVTIFPRGGKETLGEIGFNTLKHNCEEKSDKRNTRERFERADERVEEGTKEEEDEDDDNRRRREGVNG